MNIVVLTPTFFPIVGGAEVGIHEIYRRVATTDHVVVSTVIPIDSNEDGFEARDESRRGDYEVHRIRRRAIRSRTLRKVSEIFAVSEIQYIRSLKRRGEIDVLNLQFIYPHGLVALAARLMGIPVALSLVGRSDVLKGLSWWRKLHAEAVLRCANIIIANSEYYLETSPWARRATIIPYGADDAYFAKKDAVAIDKLRAEWAREGSSRTFYLLAVQRLAAVKRVDVLIEVVRLLEAKQPGKFKLIIVGTGPEQDRLRECANSLPADAVEFAGYLEEADLPDVYSAADLFLSHSMAETFGVMFAQAMASGTPPVAADTSCISMVIDSGATGITVQPFDSAAFAEAIEGLADKPEYLTKMSDASRDKAMRDFNWDDIATAHASALRNLLNDGGKRASQSAN